MISPGHVYNENPIIPATEDGFNTLKERKMAELSFLPIQELKSQWDPFFWQVKEKRSAF